MIVKPQILNPTTTTKKKKTSHRRVSQKGDRKKALTFFINRWSLSMSLSCCSSFSVRLKSHDVSYTSVSMVTKSSHRSCSPGMWRSFPRRTSDRAQSTYQQQKKKRFSGNHEIGLSYTEFWCNTQLKKQMIIMTGKLCKHIRTGKLIINHQR